MANFLILVDFISYNESIFRADFVVVCMVKLQCFYAPAMNWGGAYSFSLVHTYVHTYVRPSHFFSTVLVSTTPPKVFDAGILKLETQFRYALDMCIKETEF